MSKHSKKRGKPGPKPVTVEQLKKQLADAHTVIEHQSESRKALAEHALKLLQDRATIVEALRKALAYGQTMRDSLHAVDRARYEGIERLRRTDYTEALNLFVAASQQ